jgi:uncharacterized protein DUF4255
VANFEVIAAVSQTLKAVLTRAIEKGVAGVKVSFLIPDEPPNDPTLTLFLFEVGEDPSARNRPRVLKSAPPNVTIQKPPVALLLRYLMTAWGSTAETQQKILGLTIQALYDKAIISGPDLEIDDVTSVLEGTDEALKVTLSPLSLEERTRVWHAVQKPYRLSIAYEVRVVNLDSTEDERRTPVTRRSLDFDGVEATT